MQKAAVGREGLVEGIRGPSLATASAFALLAICGCATGASAPVGGVDSSQPISVGDINRRIDQLDAQRARRPENVELALEEAELHRRLDHFEDAEAAYREAMGMRPDNGRIQARVLDGLGQVAQVQARYGDAAMLYSEGYDRARDARDEAGLDMARYRLAVLARSLGDTTTACSWYEQMANRQPVAAQLDELACESDPAVNAFRQAARDARSSDAPEDRERLLGEAERQRQLAESAFSQGDVEADHLAETYAVYASALLIAARHEAAAAAALRGADLRPNSSYARAHAIVPLVALGRLEDADRQLAEVIRSWTDDRLDLDRRPDRIVRSEAAYSDLDAEQRAWIIAAIGKLEERQDELAERRAQLLRPASILRFPPS